MSKTNSDEIKCKKPPIILVLDTKAKKTDLMHIKAFYDKALEFQKNECIIAGLVMSTDIEPIITSEFLTQFPQYNELYKNTYFIQDNNSNAIEAARKANSDFRIIIAINDNNRLQHKKIDDFFILDVTQKNDPLPISLTNSQWPPKNCQNSAKTSAMCFTNVMTSARLYMTDNSHINNNMLSQASRKNIDTWIRYTGAIVVSGLFLAAGGVSIAMLIYFGIPALAGVALASTAAFVVSSVTGISLATATASTIALIGASLSLAIPAFLAATFAVGTGYAIGKEPEKKTPGLR